jgi:hypothetical protein
MEMTKAKEEVMMKLTLKRRISAKSALYLTESP